MQDRSRSILHSNIITISCLSLSNNTSQVESLEQYRTHNRQVVNRNLLYISRRWEPSKLPMEDTAHTDPEAWQQWSLPVLKVRLSSDFWIPQARKLRRAKTDQTTRKVKQVQVSSRVRQVTNPSRWKEEQRHLPKITHNHKTHHHRTQNPVPARALLIPQQ